MEEGKARRKTGRGKRDRERGRRTGNGEGEWRMRNRDGEVSAPIQKVRILETFIHEL
jgi:hypothetical protein